MVRKLISSFMWARARTNILFIYLFIYLLVSVTGRIYSILSANNQTAWESNLMAFCVWDCQKHRWLYNQPHPQTHWALIGSLHILALRAGVTGYWPLGLLTSQVNKNNSSFLLGEPLRRKGAKQRPSTKTTNTRIFRKSLGFSKHG